MVERYVRDVEVVGSNPVTSTIKQKTEVTPLSFVLWFEVHRFKPLKCAGI